MGKHGQDHKTKFQPILISHIVDQPVSMNLHVILAEILHTLGVSSPPKKDRPSLFSGLDYWTHGNCLWGEKGTPMRRAKTPGHKVCSSVVVTHLKVASSSVPSHSLFFFVVVVSGRNSRIASGRKRPILIF